MNLSLILIVFISMSVYAKEDSSVAKYCEEASTKELEGFFHLNEENLRETWKSHCNKITKDGWFKQTALKACAELQTVNQTVECIESSKNAGFQEEALNYCATAYEKDSKFLLSCIKEVKNKKYEPQLLKLCSDLNKDAEEEKHQLFELGHANLTWKFACLREIAEKSAKDGALECIKKKTKSKRMDCLRQNVEKTEMEQSIGILNYFGTKGYVYVPKDKDAPHINTNEGYKAIFNHKDERSSSETSPQVKNH